LQQEAHSKLGYGIASTMKLAQDLYEAGLITYMRTDCSTLSSEFATAAKKHVESTYGKEYLALNSSSRRPPSTKSTAQEAHEAIRPTYLSRAPTNLSPKHSRLYDLIYRRAVASVMAASTYACVILSIEDSGMAKSPVTKGMRFVAKHESLSFAGWEAAHGETAVNGASKAAQTAETALRGASMKACNVVAENKWDTAAARYTEASLVKAMETAGIGRPSTYVSTIKRLLDKSHAEVRDARADIVDNLDLRLLSPGKIRDDHDRRPAAEEKKRVIPTPAGGEIDAFMTQYFPEIADVAYTRVMEARLDEVATGELAYVSMMGDTCNDLATMISRVQLPDKKHALASHSSEFTFGERKFTVREARYGPVIQRIGDGHGDAPQYIPLKGYLLSMGKTLDSVGASDVQYLARLPAMAILSDNIKGTLYIGPYGFYTKNGSDKPTKVVLYKKQLPKLL
jgi:DNA topoisomerase-1